MPATHPQNSLVPSCNQCWSDQSDGALRAGGSHQSHFVDGVRWSLDTSADYLRRRQVGWLCDWQSTREVEAVPTTIHIGSDDQDDRDTPGSDKLRSSPVPLLMSHGTLPLTAAVGGCYDPNWSSVTDDDVHKNSSRSRWLISLINHPDRLGIMFSLQNILFPSLTRSSRNHENRAYEHKIQLCYRCKMSASETYWSMTVMYRGRSTSVGRKTSSWSGINSRM